MKRDWVTIIAAVRWDLQGKIVIKVSKVLLRTGFNIKQRTKLYPTCIKKKKPLFSNWPKMKRNYVTFHCRSAHQFFILINYSMVIFAQKELLADMHNTSEYMKYNFF